jgi:hypothetical protein
VSLGGVLTDQTEALRTWGAPSAPVPLTASDYIYVGKDHAFNNLYFSVATPNTNAGTIKAELWTGAVWVPITSLQDETAGFSQSGFITWPETFENFNWLRQFSYLVDVIKTTGIQTELFWMRYSITADASAGTALQVIKTLFSDDRLMTTIHPEIMRYLPSGQTDFLRQHELAKDSIVNYLMIKGLISYEEQIKDPDQWMLAATYKCIEIILAPIPGDARLDQVKKDMAQKAHDTMTMSAASIDTQKHEHLGPDSKDPGRQGHLTR